jgi:acylphosphatase
MTQVRRRALFRGRVQGVGFRAKSHRLARGFAVAGFARNLDDGRVEVVAEGEPAVVDAFFDSIQQAFGDWIRGVDYEPAASGPPFSDFSIRY